MGIINFLFGAKKKTLKMASESVDFVKIGLSLYLLPECKANFDSSYSEKLVPAIVNTVFSELPLNKPNEDFMMDENNITNIELVIEKSIQPELKLRQIITDAVRAKSIIAYAENKNLSNVDFIQQIQYPIEQLKKYRLLQKGGESPNLNDFILNEIGRASCRERV